MADLLFPKAKEGFLDSTIQWVGPAVFKFYALRSYTYNASHKFVSDVTGAGGVIVATSGALTGKTGTNGVADAVDSVWPTVPTGAPITSMILVQTSAVAGGADISNTLQRLVAFFDTAINPSTQLRSLPADPNGTDIILSIGNPFSL